MDSRKSMEVDFKFFSTRLSTGSSGLIFRRTCDCIGHGSGLPGCAFVLSGPGDSAHRRRGFFPAPPHGPGQGPGADDLHYSSPARQRRLIALIITGTPRPFLPASSRETFQSSATGRKTIFHGSHSGPDSRLCDSPAPPRPSVFPSSHTGAFNILVIPKPSPLRRDTGHCRSSATHGPKWRPRRRWRLPPSGNAVWTRQMPTEPKTRYSLPLS